eukprot:554774-Prorocentrum_minimum.AAC.1
MSRWRSPLGGRGRLLGVCGARAAPPQPNRGGVEELCCGCFPRCRRAPHRAGDPHTSLVPPLRSTF